jgi:hypothetical protein
MLLKTIFLILVTGNTLWSPYAGICTRWWERLPRGWGRFLPEGDGVGIKTWKSPDHAYI